MLDVGERIKEYTLKRFLGSGKFGEVWLAEKKLELCDEGILFALKFLTSQSNAGIDNESVRNEVNTWIKANKHANIVQVYDGFVFGRHLVIVSEYVEGGSLRDWLDANQKRAPSLVTAVEMLLGILRGLSHLHSRKIIHRDLKPENILLDVGTPKITDFGVSRIVETFSQSAPLRSTGAAGSPAYMPPEAFSDGPPLPPLDIWSAGVVFYEMLSGCRPFEGNSMYALFAEIIGKDPRPLPTAVPKELQLFVALALMKDATQRFQTAEQMRDALDKAWATLLERQHSQSKTISDEDGLERESHKHDYKSETQESDGKLFVESQTSKQHLTAEELLKRGLECEKKDDHEGAIQHFTKAIELKPDYAAAYDHRGMNCRRKGDSDQAFADYNKAIGLDPQLAHTYLNRGDIYYEEKEYDQALIDYNKAIQVNPQYATAYYKRGRFYASAFYRSGKDKDVADYDRAIRDFTKAIKFNPRYAAAYKSRAFAYKYEKHYNQALADYDKLIELSPQDAEAYLNRGYCTHRDDFEKTILDYNKAIELNPKYADAYYQRGHLHHRHKGDPDQAIADYSKAIELNPRHTDAYDERGNVYVDQGHHEKAIADYTKLIELDPKNSWAYHKRGDAYQAVGQRAKAKADRKKYEELLDQELPASSSPFPLFPF
ncbi:MAG TPA: tetratricopeptide repeat protein [Pyrinomonadaceae bacterium]|nr:tetratricopeptide repeat protein [Pyrinomonadaceae bacterium]